jgi:outer membrane protein assembly factor BamB
MRMRMRLGHRALGRGILAAGLLAAAAGCSSSPGNGTGGGGPAGGSAGGSAGGTTPPTRTLSPAPSGGDHPAAAWPTFGRDFARSGVAAGVASAGGSGSLRVSWRAHLDGAVYGQPLLVGEMAIVATENDSLYALDQATGKVLWRAHVGTPVPLSELPCGNIDPLGITGTPVYDPVSGIVYAVAETSGYHHVLIGISADGRLEVQRDIPAPDGQPRYDQQRPALTLQGGRVYVAFGGLAGDCGPYRGSVVGIGVSGSGPIISYVVPTPREGAIWAPGGPVTGPDGTLYVSVGNGSEASTSFDDSDAVTALSPDLRRTGVFAPSSWHHDNDNDLDLGSTQPVLLPGGMLLADGKSGTAYLVSSARLGGVGGQLDQAQVCPAFGTAAVQGSTVYEPCEQGGLAAASTAGGKIRVLWRGPENAWGSPVIGGGAVWVTDWKAGTLYELGQATGGIRVSLGLGTPLPHFSSMSMSGNRAYLGTMDGVVSVSGV